ncbi:MAG: hypothetical protein ABIY51_08675 [Ferruginibacter sp.]
MNNKSDHKKLNEEVEQALQSVDGIQRASAPPFLLTRIKAGIQSAAERESLWFKIASLLSRPAIATACFVVLLLINILAINFTDNFSTNSTSNTIAQQKDDYALSVISIYEPETNEPY